MKLINFNILARAVSFALTPGLPEIDKITMLPQGNIVGRILFIAREYGFDGDYWHELSYPGHEVN